VGAGIGVLSWFAFWSANHPIGVTTPFEHSAALIGKAVAPEAAANSSYFAEENPKIGWEWMLVVGVFFGGLLSARLSGDNNQLKVPPLWDWRFGPSVARRYVVAFFAAGLMMFGARLANGCTSGHGISGTLQLAVSSWVFVVLIFASAIATAFLVYGKEARHHV
jgi:hypothetical protein